MPPAKSKQTHDDPKSETPSLKDRNGHITKDTPHTNGSKLRRVASSTGSQLRDATINSPSMTATPAAVAQPANAPGV
ncbi:hypothetical protein BX600DRAFT_446074 [Xylariales sp. PMI_506]|nr:hypothetical protein BX600DRAFT_446074 [Xylariales sp. PMI_506]